MKTIYNTYVVMESQEQCDRMKQICIDNGLPYWKDEIAFLFDCDVKNYFCYTSDFMFGVWLTQYKINVVTAFSEINEEEFIELLKTK